MQLRKLLISDQECRSNLSWKHQYQIDLHFILPCSSVAARVIAILFYHYFGTTLIMMIDSHSTCLSSQLQINIGCSYHSALNSYAAQEIGTWGFWCSLRPLLHHTSSAHHNHSASEQLSPTNCNKLRGKVVLVLVSFIVRNFVTTKANLPPTIFPSIN